MQATNLQLGFPANLVHVVRPGSPLWALSLAEMDARMMEVLVFVDGVDAMTSKQMQVRSVCVVCVRVRERARLRSALA